VITVFRMSLMRADWSLLTAWLLDCDKTEVTLSWSELGNIVGGLPASATNHYPTWWSGDRPITRAWHQAGYERLSLNPVARTLTLKRSTVLSNLEIQPAAKSPAKSGSTKARGRTHDVSISDLETVDLQSTLIVLTCCSTKLSGGESNSESGPQTWPVKLLDARAHVRLISKIKSERMMPAWQRYNGFFYQPAASALKDAVSNGAHIVMISGGYGVVRAEEIICDYEKELSRSDWPDHVLEEAGRNMSSPLLLGLLPTPRSSNALDGMLQGYNEHY
jgi:hypothetical protein